MVTELFLSFLFTNRLSNIGRSFPRLLPTARGSEDLWLSDFALVSSADEDEVLSPNVRDEFPNFGD